MYEMIFAFIASGIAALVHNKYVKIRDKNKTIDAYKKEVSELQNQVEDEKTGYQQACAIINDLSDRIELLNKSTEELQEKLASYATEAVEIEAVETEVIPEHESRGFTKVKPFNDKQGKIYFSKAVDDPNTILVYYLLNNKYKFWGKIVYEHEDKKYHISHNVLGRYNKKHYYKRIKQAQHAVSSMIINENNCIDGEANYYGFKCQNAFVEHTITCNKTENIPEVDADLKGGEIQKDYCYTFSIHDPTTGRVEFLGYLVGVFYDDSSPNKTGWILIPQGKTPIHLGLGDRPFSLAMKSAWHIIVGFVNNPRNKNFSHQISSYSQLSLSFRCEEIYEHMKAELNPETIAKKLYALKPVVSSPVTFSEQIRKCAGKLISWRLCHGEVADSIYKIVDKELGVHHLGVNYEFKETMKKEPVIVLPLKEIKTLEETGCFIVRYGRDLYELKKIGKIFPVDGKKFAYAYVKQIKGSVS